MIWQDKKQMDCSIKYTITGGDFLNAGESSGAIKEYLKRLGLPHAFIRRVLIAAYEAELNVVAHAKEGTLCFAIEDQKVVITVQDRGPGIPDVPLAMQKGYSTASSKVREMGFGAGMGLPNMKQNSDTLSITTKVGKGTNVIMEFLL